MNYVKKPNVRFIDTLTTEQKRYVDEFDMPNMHLGVLCCHNHDHNESGLSIRRDNGNGCTECGKMWRIDNEDDIINSRIKYREKNRDKLNEHARKYYAENAKLINTRSAKYRKTPRGVEMSRFKSVNKRARDNGASGTFTIDEWRDTKEKFNNSCGYCGTPGDIQYDHIMPLHRGGTHYITNIVPCCAKCNERKHISTIDEWYKTQSVYDEGRYANILRHMSGL